MHCYNFSRTVLYEDCPSVVTLSGKNVLNFVFGREQFL